MASSPLDGTLEALQRLEDGPFHRLCDALIRRWNPRYRDLQPHGINDQGQSIKGQPDSFVGDTAADCSIAACYSTQRGSAWARKALDDVAAAAQACGHVEEILVASARDVSRELGKAERTKWMTELRSAARHARVRVIGGRLLATWLDQEHHDLRREYLGIPYSRLTLPAVIESAKDSGHRVLERLIAQGRFLPSSYSVRRDDRELYDRWQIACDPEHHSERRATLVPVVSGAGMGKTSLLAHFVSSFGGALPIVFIEGRRLSFTDEQTLVRAVITELQGVLSPEQRVQEEAALVHHLGEEHRLTVVVDAIDEARAPALSVIQAIEFWLESRLGRASVLIATSRADFWRLLGPERWRHFESRAPRVDSNDWRELDEERLSARCETEALPTRFTASELGDAWRRAGRQLPELYALPAHVRDALTHPFTLRAYLTLTASRARPDLGSRGTIVSAWIAARLAAEELTTERLTAMELAAALEWTARRLDERATRWLTIHDFAGAPRFDPQAPPGPVVARLIAASLLETHPEDPQLIGFAEEAVFDHFLAAGDAKAVAQDLAGTTTTLKALSFTRARYRVERLCEIGVPDRDAFVRAIGEVDPALAAVAVGADAQLVTPEVRATIANAVGSHLSARVRVDAAFAVEMLGRMRCPEAKDLLLRWIASTPEWPPVLRAYAALAALRLDSVDGADAVYAYPWLAHSGDTRYFVDLFAMFRRSSESLRRAIGDRALADLESDDPRTRARALNLIGYVGDARALPHLERRLEQEGLLDAKENHTLYAIGEAAVSLLDRSARSTAERMGRPSPGTTDSSNLYHSIVLLHGDLSYLAPGVTDGMVANWLASENKELRGMAHRLAEVLRSVPLTFAAVRRDPTWDSVPYQESYTWVDPASWLEFWRTTEDARVQAAWLRFFPAAPTVEIEDILIRCLAVPRLQARAARHLGRIASQRARKPLRELLRTSQDDWARWEAIRALGRLRDTESVNALAGVVAGQRDQSHVRQQAALSLGHIQTVESEAALTALLDDPATRDAAVSGLLRHGSSSAVSRTLALAQERGIAWLLERCTEAYRYDGRWRRQYYTHVAADDLVRVFGEHEAELEGKQWDLIQALEALDGDAIRGLFRQLFRRRGTDRDVVVRAENKLLISDIVLRELSDRGDDSVVAHFVGETLGDDGWAWFMSRELGQFSSAAVRRELATHLSSGRCSPTQLARAIRLLGAYGVREDAGPLKQFLSHGDIQIAEAAREATLSLEDPLRLPEGWGLLN